MLNGERLTYPGAGAIAGYGGGYWGNKVRQAGRVLNGRAAEAAGRCTNLRSSRWQSQWGAQYGPPTACVAGHLAQVVTSTDLASVREDGSFDIILSPEEVSLHHACSNCKVNSSSTCRLAAPRHSSLARICRPVHSAPAHRSPPA